MSIHFTIKDNIGRIEFDEPNAKVNILASPVIMELDKILTDVQSNPNLQAVLLISRKKDIFIAGADIKEIEGIVVSQEGERKARAGQDVFNKLEDLKVPTIAVIDGVALGGGCELALACGYRVATFNEKVKIGLPEVNLGILPGFGGTYRLPRLIGLTQALKIILAGRAVSSTEAYKIGLVDRLFPQQRLEESVLKFVEEIHGAKKRKTKQKDLTTRFLEGTPVGRKILFSESRKNVLKGTKGFYPAPMKALEVIQQTSGLNRASSLQIEAQGFGELVVTDISKNLVRVFYLSEKYKKFLPPGTEQLKPKSVEKCGVVGAGIMGGGIAQLLSYKGIWARLKDINFDAIGKGYKAAYKIYQDAVKKRKMKPADAAARMSLITGTVDFSGFKNADFVIEAVVENMDIKKKVFLDLSRVVSPDCVLCTNTSALSVTEMAKVTKDPSKVVGFHFFNPVNRMPLVEIISTPLSSMQSIADAFGLARRLDKTPILIKDSCGFLINRILLGYINEAGRLLQETGDLEAIDQLLTSFGMPMGPFELSDEVGLDVGVKVLHILEAAFGARFKPVDIFEKIYAQGILGKKSGKGFYLSGQKKIPNPHVVKLTRHYPNKKTLDPKEALKRMLYIMINEAARCLEEGIVDHPDAVDLGMIMGTGFPPFRGGLLRYAKQTGIERIIEELNKLEAKYQSDRFTPCPYLRRLNENQSS